MIEKHYLHAFINASLQEDIGHADITTLAVVPPGHKSRAKIIAKEPCVLAGIDMAIEVFRVLESDIKVTVYHKDGEHLISGDTICEVEGPTGALLSGERLALNLLQRLSGISTLTAKFVEKLRGTSAQVVDTRKTTPGMRAFEKYAVRVGGGGNHRFGLYDGVLIKDNHIAVAGSVTEAIRRAKQMTHHLVKVEVEVTDMVQLREALQAGADVVMLDNMSVEDMKEAVEYARSKRPDIIIEASGGITLENIRDVASTGVDIISVGALTHSARAIDIGMYVSPLAL